MQKKSELGVMSVENEEYFPFGKQVFFFEDMLKSYEERPFDVFFFSPINWESGKSSVKGYKFINNEWINVIEEIPDIIYDRAFSKNGKQKERIKDCRRALVKNNKQILNPLELVSMLNNKVKFHKFLMSKGIPTIDTVEFSELKNKNIFDLIGSERIYIKPTYGSKGEGIFVIERQPDRYKLYDNLGQAKVYKSYIELQEKLISLIDNPAQYFVQKEAKIFRYNDSPFDVRVLVQNYGKEYKVTGLGARIGLKKSMTSNLNSGGAGLPLSSLKDFFKVKYNKEVQQIEQELIDLCMNCCKVLKKEYGEFVEIGFDILYTETGAIIIEGNSKPSRWIFNVIADYLISINQSAAYYKSLRKETVKVPLLFTEHILKI